MYNNMEYTEDYILQIYHRGGSYQTTVCDYMDRICCYLITVAKAIYHSPRHNGGLQQI